MLLLMWLLSERQKRVLSPGTGIYGCKHEPPEYAAGHLVDACWSAVRHNVSYKAMASMFVETKTEEGCLPGRA